jgi:hypothetical protein
MTVNEIQARSSYLIRLSKQHDLTYDEQKELIEVSLKLLEIYALLVDLDEVTDEEIKNLGG